MLMKGKCLAGGVCLCEHTSSALLLFSFLEHSRVSETEV